MELTSILQKYHYERTRWLFLYDEHCKQLYDLLEDPGEKANCGGIAVAFAFL